MNSVMSNQVEESLRGQPTEQFIPELGEGVITETKVSVSTGMLPLKGSAAFYIAGQFDHIAKLKDGTYALIDDKTKASVKKYNGEREAETYRLQANAYAYALENPASADWLELIRDGATVDHVSALNFVPKADQARGPVSVSRIGLNNIILSGSEMNPDGSFVFRTQRAWAEIEKDFKNLLVACQKIADIVLMPTPSEAGADCDFCNDYERHAVYREVKA